MGRVEIILKLSYIDENDKPLKDTFSSLQELERCILEYLELGCVVREATVTKGTKQYKLTVGLKEA